MSAPSTSTPIDLYQPFPQGRTLTITPTPASSSFIPQYLATTFPAHAPISHIYTNRLQAKQLILSNPARASRRAQLLAERSAAQAATKRRARIGRKEAKRSGVWDLKEGEARWSLFWPIHLLWLGYIAELLQLPPPANEETLHSLDRASHKLPNVPSIQAKLVKADLHGSVLSVKRAKNLDLQGAGGIVLRETENTFRVITAKDELQVLPKKGSVFTLRIPVYAVNPAASTAEGGGTGGGPEMEFEMYGNQMCFRSSDRASRKFKFKDTIEL
ncbi:hypothetical protein DACRYDRAFT_114099 [Dacryopinax primogenitus]|uniref:Uncharacterized protein n=1 Tax=Dacryopinax primogenitus (strain DJM 731) TaxID=1858805 RepID=M5GDS1_DACPD|nr:uncharacterized protein DACRYDRAFT_114099 [Dacryopinax primogenitus]EJU04772.1 hypothetical protein DACRYDRAFT_114099 [Dacryopinax primogenitus]